MKALRGSRKGTAKGNHIIEGLVAILCNKLLGVYCLLVVAFILNKQLQRGLGLLENRKGGDKTGVWSYMSEWIYPFG